MTDWQDLYEKRDTPWEKGRPAPPLLELLECLPLRGVILVPGCGFGHDVRALAPFADLVVGVDLAEAAISAADQFPKIKGEAYVQGNFFTPPQEWESRFDVIFEHTCFCAIDPTDRPLYLQSVLTILKPAGLLAGIFFINPDHAEDGPPFRVSESELHNVFGQDFDLLQAFTPSQSYPEREGREQVRVYRRKTCADA